MFFIIYFAFSRVRKLLGDPVSASQWTVCLLDVVVSTYISSGCILFRVDFFIGLNALGIMRFTSAQSSVSSRIYNADSGSTDYSSVWSLWPSSNRCSVIWRTRNRLWVGLWVRWYPPRGWFLRCGSGGILERHILAKWPVFLQMLHCACSAVHWVMFPGVNIPPA